MVERAGIEKLHQIRKQWMLKTVAANLLWSAAIALVLVMTLHKFFAASFWWMVPVFAVVSSIMLLGNRTWKITPVQVSQLLNRLLPQLEESTGLLLMPYGDLNLLERLQVQKVGLELQESVPPDPVRKRFMSALAVFVVGLVISLLLFLLPVNSTSKSLTTEQRKGVHSLPEKILPQIKSFDVLINPPAYTGRATRRQSRFNVEVEENGTLTWQIKTNVPANDLQLKFNDNSLITLKSADKSLTYYTAQKTIIHPGFYQVNVNGQWSELYKIEMTPDKAPVINIRSPKQQSFIEYGQPQQTMLQVMLTDDYGIRTAYIATTIASGSGEAVKFKEQQMAFTGFVNGRTQQQLQQPINLKAMGMQPGDELYFYIAATDNKGQQSRSDIYIVTLEDTAHLMSMEGLANGLNIKPEFFRSQRQIIIETEELLRQKDTISLQQFNNKSNELGIDQKLLRLRYGKFLGEESNTEIGEGHDHDEHEEEHEEAATFGNAEQIMDQYAHKHDIAEDATFFDAETKKQLKATLAEMWNAEGKLRTYDPKAALPFEYKALRLLKDLQQKSRVYVAKTSSKLPPLKPAEKRLTGDLTKIINPVTQTNTPPVQNNYSELRRALGVLEQLKTTLVITDNQKAILQNASRQVATKAAADPATYLAALQHFNKILQNQHRLRDIQIVQRGLQKMLPDPAQLPTRQQAAPTTGLASEYFKHLKSSSRP